MNLLLEEPTTITMSEDVLKHIIFEDQTVRDAFLKLNDLRSDAILFVTDENHKLIGSLTDGDFRRGFIKGLTFDNKLTDYIQPDPLFIYEKELHVADLASLRRQHFLIIPLVDDELIIRDIINLRVQTSKIPADVIIMAGGRGQRLMPLTSDTPKPMLHVGDKPILEHNIDRLIKFGIKDIHISVNYLADKIVNHFKDGSEKEVSIDYIREDKPLGTLGAVKLADNLKHDYFMVMNSDILTNIDFDAFFQEFVKADADMAVATTSYQVEVPYGVLEVDGSNNVNSLKEKPKYTYYSNAGIYLFKKDLLSHVPKGEFYNVTDLMELLLTSGKKLISYPIMGYWLDIGKHEDFKKAQEDIKYIKL